MHRGAWAALGLQEGERITEAAAAAAGLQMCVSHFIFQLRTCRVPPACSVPAQLPAPAKAWQRVQVTARATVINPAEARPRGDEGLAVFSVGDTHFCVSQMQTKEHF